jgi:hypothetical protein
MVGNAREREDFSVQKNTAPRTYSEVCASKRRARLDPSLPYGSKRSASSTVCMDGTTLLVDFYQWTL